MRAEHGAAFSIGFRSVDWPKLPWWTKLWRRIFPGRLRFDECAVVEEGIAVSNEALDRIDQEFDHPGVVTPFLAPDPEGPA